MDNESAIDVISALSQGYNPLTGEQLPGDGIFNQPNIIRALFVAKHCIERCGALDRRRQTQPAKTGAPWTPDDEALLVSQFSAGKTFYELAQEFSRTQGAIQARLIKLGKIEDTGQLRFVQRG